MSISKIGRAIGSVTIFLWLLSAALRAEPLSGTPTIDLEEITFGAKLQGGAMSQLEIRGKLKNFRSTHPLIRPISFVLGSPAATLYFKTVPEKAYREDGNNLHFSSPGDFWLKIDKTTGSFQILDTEPGTFNPRLLNRIILRIGSQVACVALEPSQDTRLRLDYGQTYLNNGRVYAAKPCERIDEAWVEYPKMDEKSGLVPEEFFFGVSAHRKAWVRVNAIEGLDPDSVELIRVDRFGKVLSQSGLCKLNDNGDPKSADTIAGDLLYSCDAELKADAPGEFFLSARASWRGVEFRSQNINYLFSIVPVESARDLVTAEKAAYKRAFEVLKETFAANTSFNSAIQAALVEIEKLPHVRAAYIAPEGNRDHIWVIFESGRHERLFTRGNVVRLANEPSPERERPSSLLMAAGIAGFILALLAAIAAILLSAKLFRRYFPNHVSQAAHVVRFLCITSSVGTLLFEGSDYLFAYTKLGVPLISLSKVVPFLGLVRYAVCWMFAGYFAHRVSEPALSPKAKVALIAATTVSVLLQIWFHLIPGDPRPFDLCALAILAGYLTWQKLFQTQVKT